MNRSVNIRPCADGIGYILEFGSQMLWFAEEVHAINYVQDRCSDCDVLVYDTVGDLIRHYVPAESAETAEAVAPVVGETVGGSSAVE